jgi:hypothetical protein
MSMVLRCFECFARDALKSLIGGRRLEIWRGWDFFLDISAFFQQFISQLLRFSFLSFIHLVLLKMFWCAVLIESLSDGSTCLLRSTV